MKTSKLVEPIKTYSRWPVKHKDKLFGDKLEFLMYLHQTELEDDKSFEKKISYFHHSKYYFVRAALESKFNRHFSFAEVKRIINDTSWQWRNTLQPLSNEKKDIDASQ